MSEEEQLEARLRPYPAVARLLSRFGSGFPASIDIGDGWLPLLEETVLALEALVPDFTVAQVKEKFGGLRFYWDPPFESECLDEAAVERALVLVSVAEKRSYTICEVCGAVGSARGRGWVVTRCDEHRPR